jgi:hypothetical protein
MTNLVEPELSPARDRTTLPAVWELLFVAAAGSAYAIRWSHRAGKGISWDQQNYHYYNAYAWLSGRMDYDVAPAGMHSWLNPLLYVPHYWVINHFSPVVAAAAFAAVQSVNLLLLYWIARIVLQGCSRWLAIGIALICAIVGCSEPFLFSQLGTTDSDYLVSIPVLAGVGALCWACLPDKIERRRELACGIGGVLLGAAAGLKWTCFAYAIGMTVALLALWRILDMRPRRFLLYAAGGVAGFLPAGGYWNWLLWTRYRNPVFPFWNDVFHSPWAVPADFRDERFLAPTFREALSYPFQVFAGLHPTAETAFRDARIAFLALLIPVVAVVLLARRLARWRVDRNGQANRGLLAAPAPLWLLLTFSVVSYCLWLHLFSIQRYLSPLTLLSGLLIFLCIDYLFAHRAAKLAAFFLIAGFCLSWMRAESQGWRVPYGSDWFGLRLPAETQAPDTLFIMLGDGPMGYVVPFLPPSSRTVRLLPVIIPPDAETELRRRAREIIAQHSGPMRSLATQPLAEADYDYLRRFGLALDLSGCAEFYSAVDRFTECSIFRLTAPQ